MVLHVPMHTTWGIWVVRGRARQFVWMLRFAVHSILRAFR